MELLPLTFTTGWTSGTNAYATVLALGLLGRFAGVDSVPAGLQRTDVMIIAGVHATVELVAAKIPFVDSVWDVVSTIVRPITGAAIGASLLGDVVVVSLTTVAVLFRLWLSRDRRSAESGRIRAS